ncbi:ribose-5-phosphate isomerase RpiA [Paenibacillus radicis (ex Gao et al. 2016)]|uniref:Ribose-5-phosphate isomerase A n=1 Tax=Paenibacillus radicis (ex Gao et al. 2016) TaxID=1737354 RepID=A0A917M3G4_9BACL|nr:ribose-5-phosphate isomerase RpiA [Paenibacillus radicis (ex Gao et al. 2016)]GGG72771.1 ribose-5-phosphate isomerase A [Paenibacillus radicis (ex Gao et al. 2016)]
MDAKRLAGERAADYVEDGMAVGLGTGSTVYWTLMKLGERIKDGLHIKGIATSKATEKLAAELGIPLTDFAEVEQLDLAIDGADEFDARLQLIKGGGGALLREKLVAANAKRFIVVADDSKAVTNLGKFPLPVEVVQFGWEATRRQLEKLGCSTQLRMKEQAPFISDNGNYIIDCQFEAITDDAVKLNEQMNRIPGVVENGLFVNMADLVIVGGRDGVVTEQRREI